MKSNSNLYILFLFSSFLCLVLSYFFSTIFISQSKELLCNQEYFPLLGVLSIALVVFIWQKYFFDTKVSALASGIITGGSLHNLFEHISFGCVNDYFNFFELFKFNVADLFITVGISMLALTILSKKSLNS